MQSFIYFHVHNQSVPPYMHHESVYLHKSILQYAAMIILWKADLPAPQVSEEEGPLRTASGVPSLQHNGKKSLCHWWFQVWMGCDGHQGDWLIVSHSQHRPHLFRHLQKQNMHKHKYITVFNWFYADSMITVLLYNFLRFLHSKPRFSISCTTSFQTGSMWMQLKHQSEVIFIRYGLL